MYPIIFENDICIFERIVFFKSGDICAVEVNGKRIICIAELNDLGVLLSFKNSNYKSIQATNQQLLDKDITVIGKLIKQTRLYK